jgi:membrane-associated phospholipid phosphatase
MAGETDELTERPADDSTRARRGERRAAARRLSRAEAIYLVALAAFAALALFARAYAYFSWDLEATRALQGLPVPGLLAVMRAASVFADTWHGWALTAAAFLIFFMRRRRTEACALVFSVGGAELIDRVVKSVVGRPRPIPALVHVSGEWAHESFPSGHVTFYVCFFGFLFFAAYALLPRGTNPRRLLLALAALPVVTIGFSRVYLGAHWASDVLGAYLLSGLWLALTLHLYRRWKARSTFHPDELKETETESA